MASGALNRRTTDFPSSSLDLSGSGFCYRWSTLRLRGKSPVVGISLSSPPPAITQGSREAPRDSGELLVQSLCAWLADVELGADYAHRGNSVLRKLLGEQLSRHFAAFA
mgnify:CR=1 FL=1